MGADGDDIIAGNIRGRAGDPLPSGISKYYRWGYYEGKRHRTMDARVRILEDRAGIASPTEPDEE